MKRLLIIPFLLYGLVGKAQLFNDGAIMMIEEDAQVGVRSTDMINNGEVHHNGFLLVDSSITNDRDWTCGDVITSTIQFRKNWYNNNSFEPGVGLVQLIGNTQIIGGSMSTDFYDLLLEGPNLALKRMDNDIVVHDLLDLNDAELATTNFEALLEGTALPVSRNSGFVSTDFSGRLNRHFDKGSANDHLFPLGRRDGNDVIYSPIVLHMAGSTIFRTAFIYEDANNYGMSTYDVLDTLCTVNDEFFHIVGSTAPQNTTYTILAEDVNNWTTLGEWTPSWSKVTNSYNSGFIGMDGIIANEHQVGEDIPVAFASEKPYVNIIDSAVTVRPLEDYVIETDYYAPGYSSIYWTPADYLSCITCEDPMYTAGTAGMYEVTVDNGTGCEARDSIWINLDREGFGVFVPTAFTPQNDDLNETFLPVTQPYVKLREFRIYNRWGEQIYEGLEGWDGTYQGVDVQMGVYVYICVVEEILANGDTRTSELNGTITLVR